MRMNTRIAVVATVIMAIAGSINAVEPAPAEAATSGSLTLRGSPDLASTDVGVRSSHAWTDNSECIDGRGCGSYVDHEVAAPSSSLTQLRPASFAR